MPCRGGIPCSSRAAITPEVTRLLAGPRRDHARHPRIRNELSHVFVRVHDDSQIHAIDGRVAIGDEIGGLLSADLVAVLIGERPGLSAADSLGVYVTWQPAPGTVDAARNCLSNIRPAGMPIPEAAAALLHLMTNARRHRMTGVALSQLGR